MPSLERAQTRYWVFMVEIGQHLVGGVPPGRDTISDRQIRADLRRVLYRNSETVCPRHSAARPLSSASDGQTALLQRSFCKLHNIRLLYIRAQPPITVTFLRWAKLGCRCSERGWLEQVRSYAKRKQR